MSVQSMSALALANETRRARAVLKREIRTRETTVAAVVLTNPECARRMTVADLLGCQHRWGPEKVGRFLATVPLSETRKVGDLTERQRRLVASRLNGTLRQAEDMAWAEDWAA